jgi:hypothetical protein
MALDLAFGAYYQTDIPKSSRSLQNLYWIQWLSEPSKIQLRTDLDFSCFVIETPKIYEINKINKNLECFSPLVNNLAHLNPFCTPETETYRKCFSNVHLDFLLFLFASPELLTDLLAFL